MQIPLRTIVPGLLLAFSAMPVRAQSTAPEAPPIAPATTQQSTPINLSLPPATTRPSTAVDLTLPSAPVNLSLPPATTQPTTPIDPALLRAAAQRSTLANPVTPPPATPQPGLIELAVQAATASDEVKRVTRWVIESGDNAHLPFLVIDKVNARVFVFNTAGQLKGAAPALLGMAHGDRLLAPNSATMAQMPPQVRITPAGRFISKLAIDSLGKELLVLDYDASISLHAVVKGTPQEHRAERLSSATAQDNRISFGCINVPTAFYSTIVSPTFTNTRGIVYVLPETSTATELFGIHPPVPPASGGQQSSGALSALVPQAIPAPDAR
jgi:hypothetical protein